MRVRFTGEGVEITPSPDHRLTMMRSRYRAHLVIAGCVGTMIGSLLMVVLLGIGGVL